MTDSVCAVHAGGVESTTIETNEEVRNDEQRSPNKQQPGRSLAAADGSIHGEVRTPRLEWSGSPLCSDGLGCGLSRTRAARCPHAGSRTPVSQVRAGGATDVGCIGLRRHLYDSRYWCCSPEWVGMNGNSRSRPHRRCDGGRGRRGKRRFRTHSDAVAALRAAKNARRRAELDGARTEHREVRDYECEACGGWHLTSALTPPSHGALGGSRQPIRAEIAS